MQLLIAVLMFDAKVAALLLVANVPAVELVQPFDPLSPAVRTPEPVVFVNESVTARKFPGKSAVNVSVDELREDVNPIAGKLVWQLAIAVLKFVALVDEVLELTNVPTVALLQPFEPPGLITRVLELDPPVY